MSAFNEDSRVKFPTLIHLMKMGYKYITSKGFHNKNFNYEKEKIDTDTNILVDRFKEAYLRLNPNKNDVDAERKISDISSKLENDNLCY